MEMNIIDEDKSNMIRKKSSFLCDSSYRIFHITKQAQEDSDDDNNQINMNNHEPIINKRNKKLSKIKNRNGLKELLFLHKNSYELSSIVVKTPSSSHKELSRSVIDSNITSSRNNKSESVDRTIVQNHLFVRTDRFPPSNRKQTFINMHPELQASFHRRRQRFIVACGTVSIALTIIITIIIYAIIMTVNHKIQLNQ